MRHGWFEIAGIQTGAHTVKARVDALPQVLRDRAKGASILDLGCAEGLLSKYLMDNCSARSVIGLDVHLPYLELAKSIMRDHDAKYLHVDLDHLETFLELHPDAIVGQFDIVLAMCIAQKMSRPEVFLKTAASLSSDMLLLETPNDVVVDPRSGSRPIIVQDVLAPVFMQVWNDVGPANTHRALFRRM